MHFSSYLDFAAAFLAFCLRIGAAFLFCFCLARILRRPQHRFAAWLLFLFFTAGYWMVLLGEAFAGDLPDPATPAKPSAVRFVPAASHWFVPKGWVHSLAEGIIILGCVYGGLVVLMLAWRAVAHLRLRSLLRFASAPSPQLAALAEKLSQEFGIQRCEVLVLPGITSPATVYWWKPCILLPAVCEELGNCRQVADVLRHELAHIVRRDYLLAGVTDAICTALFFHPAAWYARKQLRLQRELACDLAVVEKCPDHRADYADTLARFMRMRIIQSGPTVGIDFSAAPSVLGTRIRSILHEPGETPRWKSLGRVAVGSLLLLTFAVTAPALSVLLDVRNDSRAATSITSQNGSDPQVANYHLVSHHRAHQPQSGETASAYQAPQDMTALKVQDRAADLPTGLISAKSKSLDADSLETQNSTWSGTSPSDPGYQPPTVHSVVIAAIGGIASAGAGEHEHAGHGKHVGR